jgi:hypothetical protein
MVGWGRRPRSRLWGPTLRGITIAGDLLRSLGYLNAFGYRLPLAGWRSFAHAELDSSATIRVDRDSTTHRLGGRHRRHVHVRVVRAGRSCPTPLGTPHSFRHIRSERRPEGTSSGCCSTACIAPRPDCPSSRFCWRTGVLIPTSISTGRQSPRLSRVPICTCRSTSAVCTRA